MNYIDDIAWAIYIVQPMFDLEDRDQLLPDKPLALTWEEVGPNEKRLLRMYALLAYSVGKLTTVQDVHDAWSAWQCDQKPDHWYIVPFEELPKDVQEKDRSWMNAIRRVAIDNRIGMLAS